MLCLNIQACCEVFCTLPCLHVVVNRKRWQTSHARPRHLHEVFDRYLCHRSVVAAYSRNLLDHADSEDASYEPSMHEDETMKVGGAGDQGDAAVGHHPNDGHGQADETGVLCNNLCWGTSTTVYLNSAPSHVWFKVASSTWCYLWMKSVQLCCKQLLGHMTNKFDMESVL